MRAGFSSGRSSDVHVVGRFDGGGKLGETRKIPTPYSVLRIFFQKAFFGTGPAGLFPALWKRIGSLPCGIPLFLLILIVDVSWSNPCLGSSCCVPRAILGKVRGVDVVDLEEVAFFQFWSPVLSCFLDANYQYEWRWRWRSLQLMMCYLLQPH
ncbi:hypothetical protein BDV28DRAFT_39889 [Aspergillus coremiiformis]|uniref:Uncharacterized protein n=1 Tax=Aspergillus coremiiformis TaxID=138285 RepID=A0A5N6Z0D8_9EURO|nr:hypothetical protein BDV28DRAFT_39889 [Aspergillus coremiiformis]